MILLQQTTSAQTVRFLPNISKGSTVNGATFEFFDSYSGQTISTSGNVVPDGFRHSVTLTVVLENDRRYELTVRSGTETIYTDTVFVSRQLNTTGTDADRLQSVDDYSLTFNEWAIFDLVVGGEALQDDKTVFGDVVPMAARIISDTPGPSESLNDKELSADDASLEINTVNIFTPGTSGLVAFLPPNPMEGSCVYISNLSGHTDNVINPNGRLIQGMTDNLILNDDTASFKLSFTNTPAGWVLLGIN